MGPGANTAFFFDRKGSKHIKEQKELESPAHKPSLASCTVPMPMDGLSPIDRRHPSKDLCVVGITGTNGKTTVAHLIEQTLTAAGHNCFVLGTLNSGDSNLSTPEAADICAFMTAHLDRGGTHFVMEVTSEGIDQGRVYGIDFDVKLLTNITRDHLDYHKTFGNYKRAKLGFMHEGDACKIHPDTFENEPADFSSRLLGKFNRSNIKAAACALRNLGISQHQIHKTLTSCPSPRGRLEELVLGQSFKVLIDYAHTPDALLNVLGTVKKIASDQNGRLLVMFGCGGNRDRGKRPKMGNLASQFADLLVITDDNPRLEDSIKIISEIVTGLAPGFTDYVAIQDRRKAIEFILGKAQNGDVVLLAGKGHETQQVVGLAAVQFDDLEEARRVIRQFLTNPDIAVQAQASTIPQEA
jgi:UDP-N-acetylmuramoyl-L-alanyl-D-glutamate--2,6-diaminopimelate ligase